MSINTTTHEVAERSIREKLIALKRLQETLTSIDKIKLLRGELPQAIEDLADEIEGLKTRLELLPRSSHSRSVVRIKRSLRQTISSRRSRSNSMR